MAMIHHLEFIQTANFKLRWYTLVGILEKNPKIKFKPLF